jgi:hypothetical protein
MVMCFSIAYTMYQSCYNIYCDMKPESRNRPLLDNGSLTRFPATTGELVETKALLRN